MIRLLLSTPPWGTQHPGRVSWDEPAARVLRLWPCVKRGALQAFGPGAVPSAGVGMAMSHGVMLASGAVHTRTAQNPRDWVRQLVQQVRRGLPGHWLVLAVAGSVAAVSSALACGTPQVVMVSRRRWDTALY